MSERYPGEREIEQLYSQADNVPESGTGTIMIRDVQEVMAGANDQVLIDHLELVDLRQQLDDARQARKDIEDSQQAIVILWREQQTRAERAERERDEARAEIAAAHKRIDAQVFDHDGRRLALSERIDGVVKRAIDWRRKALVAEQQLPDCEVQRKQAVEVAALRAVEIATLQGEAAAMRRALLRWKCPDCAGEGSRWVMLRQPEHDVDSLQAYVQCAACGGTGLYPTARAALQQKGGEG